MTNRRTFIKGIVAAAASAAIPKGVLAATTAKPVIFWVTPACPTAYTCPDANKGEGNNGGYVHILGTNLGAFADYTTIVPPATAPAAKVTIGAQAIANYRFLCGARADSTRSTNGGGFTDQTSSGAPGLQILCVQVGALGNAPAGTPINVKVTTAAGASNVLPFTPSPGSIFYVSKSGNDGTAQKGNFSLPWRYLQSGNGSVAGSISMLVNGGNGDQVVICDDGSGPYTDVTTNPDGSNWFRCFRSGHAGNSTYWWGMIGYPGAAGANAPQDVQYVTPAGKDGGINGPATWDYQNGGYFYTVELNLSCDPNASLTAAPIYHQAALKPWATISCLLGPWQSTGAAKGAGVCGNSQGSIVMGCEITKMDGTSQENHCIYPSTYAKDWTVRYNYLHAEGTGSIISENDPLQMGGTNDLAGNLWLGLTGMDYSFNIMDGAGKHGINKNYSTISGTAVGNLITNIVGVPFRYDIESPHAPINQVYEFNTVFNCYQATSASDIGVFDIPGWRDDVGGGQGGTIHFRHNICAAGPNTLSSCPELYVNSGGAFPFTLDFDQNVWAGWDYVTYGSGGKQGWVSGQIDGNYHTADPDGIWCDAKTGLFKNATASPPNLHLANTSPALDAATTTMICTPPTLDVCFIKRPKSTYRDIGAYEHT